jgi:hypothetical protein
VIVDTQEVSKLLVSDLRRQKANIVKIKTKLVKVDFVDSELVRPEVRSGPDPDLNEMLYQYKSSTNNMDP